MSNAPHDSLQRWLETIRDSAGSAPPEGLEPEVVETVYALRPDLAPPPRLSIDDILDSVQDGPFAARAAAFAAWLDRPDTEDAPLPDDDDPDNDEQDALETVYALRPDLAPPPRLSIDDILDSVQDGPFARPLAPVLSLPLKPLSAPTTTDVSTVAAANTRAVTDTPKGAAGGEVVSLASRRRPPMRWAVPGIGALLAAAAVLLVVQPMGLAPFGPADPALDAARYAPTSTPAPAAAEATPEDVRQRDIRPQSAPEPDAETDAEKETAAQVQGGVAIAPATVSMPSAAPPPSVPMAGEAQEPLRQLGYLSDNAQEGMALAEPAAPTTTTATTTATATGPALSAATGRSAGADSSASAGLSMRDAPAPDVAAYADDEVVSRTESRADGRSERPNRGSSGWGLPAKRSEAAESPAPAAADMDDAYGDQMSEIEEESAPSENTLEGSSRAQEAGGGAGASLASLKVQASWSMGGIPNVKATDATWAAASAQAAALAGGGQVGDALAMLAPFQGSASPDVRMDAAWERAQLYLRQGQVQPALRTVDSGLAATGGDRRLRARLLYQKGLLLERLGDPEGALRAYQAAAALR